jgi:hypothetical protein
LVLHILILDWHVDLHNLLQWLPEDDTSVLKYVGVNTLCVINGVPQSAYLGWYIDCKQED